MTFILFLKGIVVGIAVSAPLGPMAMMVVQRCLNSGRRTGFISGLGVAAADTSFALIAGFGLSFIIDFITEQQMIIQLTGASILLFLGIRLFTRNPAHERRKQLKKKSNNPWEAFISMYFLTLSNPVGVFILGGIFAAFGLIGTNTSFNEIFYLIIGVVFGAVLWWFLLTTLLSTVGKQIRLRSLLWINKISGLIIMGFGLFIILSVFSEKNRFKMPVDKKEKSKSTAMLSDMNLD